MSKETILTIAAQCDKAARDGANEDNCLLVSEVGVAKPSVNHFGDVTARDLSKMIPLRGKGCLLVVADGMGGMNAGEVASEIAVTTLQKQFSVENMKQLDISSDTAVKKFIRKAIISADEAIKKAAAKDKEKEGMGTTVALLWLLENNTAYYAWCGDSRIYRYTPDGGLQTLSHDHSYVMEVLHLSEEEAFDHPNNNIITRSLGNPSEKANPEIEGPIDIYKDDLFLLCSDGLCGVLPSRKIHAEISCIEDVIEEHIPDADHLMDGINELWTAAAAAGWHDNVTTLLCQVKTGLKRPEAKKKPKALQTSESNTSVPPIPNIPPRERDSDEKRGRKDSIIALLVVALVAVIVAAIIFGIRIYNKNKEEKAKQEQVQKLPKKQETEQKEILEENPTTVRIDEGVTRGKAVENNTVATQHPVQNVANPATAGNSPASVTDDPSTETSTPNSTVPKYRGKPITGSSASQDTKQKGTGSNKNNNKDSKIGSSALMQSGRDKLGKEKQGETNHNDTPAANN